MSSNDLVLRDLLTDVEALKTTMTTTINGNSPDHAKWVSFKSVATRYKGTVERYVSATGDVDDLPYYDPEQLGNSMNTTWIYQKQIFETIYNEVLKLHGRITNRLTHSAPATGFDDLLHPDVRAVASNHYQAGHYRSAVLDAVVAIYDKIRARTGLDLDGDKLCTTAFSVNNPILVFSEVDTESGKNDQVGFMDIFRGVYRGVRNPKAHSLVHDLDEVKAGQYLVLASLLMRRVEEASARQGSAPEASDDRAR